jgi:ferritin-like protein
MTDYHEPVNEISAGDRNIIRAMSSLREEIDAIGWYHQRAAVCKDGALKAILVHNRNEEIEHACMALEWLRRNMEGWDERMRNYLFTEGNIAELEEKLDEEDEKPADLGIGSQKKRP